MFNRAKKNQEAPKQEDKTDLMGKWIAASSGEDEGHLSVDVYQAGDNLVVKSTIAGARSEDLDISVTGDILTIKGERRLNEEIEYNDYLYRECYWGKFSRTIILPAQIDEDGVKANLENGVLTVVLPKIKKSKELKIKVRN